MGLRSAQPPMDVSQYLSEKNGQAGSAPPMDVQKYLSEKSGGQSLESQKSSYDDVPDDQLNFVQKTERGAQKIGLIKPGYEMFSPATNENRNLVLKTAANTAALGYEPQVEGLLKSGSVSSPEYIQARDKASSELENAPAAIKGMGTAIGMIPSLAIPNPNFATSVAGKIAQAAGVGGLLSAVSNPGDVAGKLDPIQAGQRVENAAKGAAFSGSLAGAAEAIPAVTKKLDIFANKKALKQSGLMLKDLRALDQTGQLEYAGKTLLDHGVLTPGATVEDIANRTGKKIEEIGSRIGSVESALDEKFPQLVASPVGQSLPNPTKMATDIENQILPQLDSVALKKYKPQIMSYVEDLKSMGNQPIPFSEAKKELAGFDKLLNWDKEQDVGKQLAKQVRGVINKNIEDGVDAVGKATDFPLYENWKKDKTDFGIMKKINEIANDKEFRKAANNTPSLTDYGMGIGGAMVAAAGGHSDLSTVLAGLGVGAANHLAKKYGNAAMSVGADRISSALKQPGAQGFIKGAAAPAIVSGLIR